MPKGRLLDARWRLLQVGLDVAAWVVALTFTTSTLYGFPTDQLSVGGLLALILVASAVHLVMALVCQLYRGRYKFGSFDEALGLCRAWCATTATLVALNIASGPGRLVPITVPVVAACAAAVLMSAARVTRRASKEHVTRRSQAAAEPVIVFGAGTGGSQAIQAMLLTPNSRYRPVAALDDDPDKRHLQMMGVPVVGPRHALAEAARRYDARLLVVAVPSADATLLRWLSEAAHQAGLQMKVVPSVGDLVSGRVRIQDIRDVNLEDLLGRHAVETDVRAVADHIRGKRVLVTGAGGSIGSELCRVISEYGPAKLFMLDRDESALHAVQLSLTGRALLDSDDLVLADIRDLQHLLDTFERLRPEIVFHAAALKHLTLLERFPAEAVKTNVWGTCSVLDAATRSGVQHFVNVSTDKAADPTSVLGYSKRLAERLTSSVATRTGRNYVSVRFGNVLGSRGSVLTAFTAQAAAGGPITVTHPDVTRYFMTVREAVQLMLQASAVSQGGHALVLDMGEPVRISEVAKRVASTVNGPIDIVYTGLRPGEKLHEDLLGDGEEDLRPFHPLISQVPVPPLDVLESLRLDISTEPGEIIESMRRMCTAPAEGHHGADSAGSGDRVIELPGPRQPWPGPERRRSQPESKWTGMPPAEVPTHSPRAATSGSAVPVPAE
jgi:FlaA1/EpsC-like NDP-sugar epimerase